MTSSLNIKNLSQNNLCTILTLYFKNVGDRLSPQKVQKQQ